MKPARSVGSPLWKPASVAGAKPPSTWHVVQLVVELKPAWLTPPKAKIGTSGVPVLAAPKPAQAKPAATSGVVPPGVKIVGGPAWQDMHRAQETGVAAMVGRSP